jgi:hypothetical protein
VRDGEFAKWGACEGAVGPSQELCGDGIDNDCDGEVDEGCAPCIRKEPGATPWQMHYGEGAVRFAQTFATHGAAGEYAYATIPPAADAGWRAHAAPNISFSDPSTLCSPRRCRDAGDFTYFQTFLDVPSAAAVQSFTLRIGAVDDGVRITVFNDKHPQGYTPPNGYIALGMAGLATDIAPHLSAGRNRIVLTHVDDCCDTRAIRDAVLALEGTSVTECPAVPTPAPDGPPR